MVINIKLQSSALAKSWGKLFSLEDLQQMLYIPILTDINKDELRSD